MSGIFISDRFKEYELIDAGGFNRLERWGKYTLVRPDPQALWPKGDSPKWKKPDAVYHRSDSGGGKWEFLSRLPSDWTVKYDDLTFKIALTGFKHTGLFPEQAYNWDKIRTLVRKRPNAKILNLFGYTGAATVAAAKEGASVCHVDSSKGMLTWCKDNAALSSVAEGKIRLIPEDCIKFVEREKKRRNSYDGIIMDPPSFGRGSKGEVWKLEDDLWALLKVCGEILSEKPLFMLINSYTAGVSPLVMANMVESLDLPKDNTEFGELALPFRNGERLLPCGLTLCSTF